MSSSGCSRACVARDGRPRQVAESAKSAVSTSIVSSLPIADGVIGAGYEIKWPPPTRPGDALKVEIEVVDIKPSMSRPHLGIVKIKATTMNQNREPVQILEIVIVVPRRRARRFVPRAEQPVGARPNRGDVSQRR